MSRIYSASKIGINFSLNNDINMRIVEILSCRAMLITSRIEDNGFSELFIEGKHLVTYKDREELAAKIEYYLKHENERQRIAQEGYKLVVNEHTYKNRLEKMFSIIKENARGQFEGLKL